MVVCFLTSDRKEMDLDKRKHVEEFKGVGRGETIIKTYCMKNINFQQKKINEKAWLFETHFLLY